MGFLLMKGEINDMVKRFFSRFSNSCCSRDVLLVLGSISRATHHGNLWENHEEVIECGRYVPQALHCAHLRFRNNLFPIDVHQSAALQHHEPQIPKRVKGKWKLKVIKGILRCVNMT